MRSLRPAWQDYIEVPILVVIVGLGFGVLTSRWRLVLTIGVMLIPVQLFYTYRRRRIDAERLRHINEIEQRWQTTQKETK